MQVLPDAALFIFDRFEDGFLDFGVFALGDVADIALDDARFAGPPISALSVSLNLPMRFASIVNCDPPTRPDSTTTLLSA